MRMMMLKSSSGGIISSVMTIMIMLLSLALIASKKSRRSASGRSAGGQEAAASSCTEDFSFQTTESSETFFASLLNPITIDEFFANHFQKKAANAKRPEMPGYYGPMATFDDVEYAIENGFSRDPNQRLQYGKDWKLAKRIFKNEDYWTGLYSGRSGGNDVSLSEAMEAVSAGFTVIMNGVQSCMPNVHLSAWQLEAALGWRVNVNLYLSPPGGSQGFEAHIDWMDGFILQITGKKRWKVYEPPLVSFPRFDMVRKPPLSFLDFDSEETDLVMAAGDLAYIPRGFVHQASTSSEDVNYLPEGNEQDPYQLPSMHLTFGIELAKDASLEMLLHHFISKLSPRHFLPLAESAQPSNASTETFRFDSDNGKFFFECQSSEDVNGIKASKARSDSLNSLRCTEKDVLHLLLAAVASHISSNEKDFVKERNDMGQSEGSFSSAKLRQAVGVTNRTVGIASLNPRVLLPEGLRVFSEAVARLGVKRLLYFLLEKKMLTVTSVPAASCENNGGSPSALSSLLGAAAGAVFGSKGEGGGSDVAQACESAYVDTAAETLHPSSESMQSFTTLGSDFSCNYIENFFSFNVKVQVSNQTTWDRIVSSSTAAGGENERAYDREALEKLLLEDTWTHVENAIADFIERTLGELASPSDLKTKSELEEGSGSIVKKQLSRHGAYIESDAYCDAWKSMINVLSVDKRARKRSGLQSLENAGYEMNAS